MMLIGDLIIRTEEIHSGMILKYSGIAVIPFTVYLDEIPVVAVCDNRVSLDHHVGNSGTVEKHFRAGEINEAVTTLTGKPSVSGIFIRQLLCNYLI